MPDRGKHEGDSLEGQADLDQADTGRRRIGNRGHAAAKHAARRHVLLVRIPARKLSRALMGADDVAEGIELRGVWPGGEGAKRRLEQKHQGRGERDPYAPSSPPDVQDLPLHAATADT